jgi:DNA-binding transcriptional LysR family regulator
LNRTQLPSTQALKVFETVCRYRNCTHAALELCLSPSAVSKQLQSLEANLGVKLFLRSAHGMLLSKAGQVYLDCIKPVLIKLEEATARVSREQHHAETLHLQVPLGFADRWLLMRFPELLETSLKDKVQVSAHPFATIQRTFPYRYDAYVCFGEGTWPGCVAEYLFGKELILVASPRLLRRNPPIQSPSDVAHFTILEHSEIPIAWAQAYKTLDIDPNMILNTIKCDFYSILIRSVCVGIGLAMIPKVFIKDELESEILVQILNFKQTISYGYYFVFPEERKNDFLIKKFQNWLHLQKDTM